MLATEKILSDYLTERELAEQLGRGPRTIQRWRAMRQGPTPTFIGATPVYRIDAVRAWLRSREERVSRTRTRNLRGGAHE